MWNSGLGLAVQWLGRGGARASHSIPDEWDTYTAYSGERGWSINRSNRTLTPDVLKHGARPIEKRQYDPG